MKSNCLLWAWRKWRKHGGYICFRRSQYWWGFHVLWLSKEGELFVHFHPPEPFFNGRKLRWWEVVRLIRFEGIITVGDRKD